MPNTLRKPPRSMTIPEFLDWPGDGTGRKFQLIEGEARVMSPGKPTHGRLQSGLSRLIGNVLVTRASPCDVVTDPGVAAKEGDKVNVRIPDLGVTCAPDAPGPELLPDPILLIEVLSPGNVAETWENAWAYRNIPSLREIPVVHSTRVLVELLRRAADGRWPEQTERIGEEGMLTFDSIGFECSLTEVYARTHLGSGGAT